MCVKLCVCVHASWLKGGVAVGVTHCKKALNFQMDSQTCTRFIAKADHVQKDSCLGQLAIRRAVGVASVIANLVCFKSV